jgi:agmatinase
MKLREKLDGYLRLERSFFGIPEPEDEEPDIGILGIPYDLTSSHTPGSRFGPDAIRKATDSERSHGYPLLIGKGPIDSDKPLSEIVSLEDIGDLEVGVQLPESVEVHISEAAKILSTSATWPIFLGGDHFITYPIMRGLKRGAEAKWGLFYLDSHADFYDDYGGANLSHASTVRRIVEQDIVDMQDIVSYDMRCAPPDQRTELQPLISEDITSIEEVAVRFRNVAQRVEKTHLSIDLDILDPVYAPGVSHPESGGLSVEKLVTLIRLAFATGKISSVDIVEYNPMLDHNGLTAVAARNVLKEVLWGFATAKRKL